MTGEWGWLDPTLVDLIDRPAAGALQLVALLVAVGIGAVHALGPGHGKALVGAYLAGQPGRVRDAAGVGVLVALMHSGSVLVLGFALHRAQRLPLGEALEPAVGLLSGLAVAAVGGALLWRRRRASGARAALDPAGSPAVPAGTRAVPAGSRAAPGQAGHHALGAAHRTAGHHHHEPPDGVAPLSRAGIAALATTGGLLPSPAAFLVLTTALAMGHAGYGLALVGAFSVGMALTLTAVGLVALSGGRMLTSRATAGRRAGRLARHAPTLSAAAILLGGTLIAAGALRAWWLL